MSSLLADNAHLISTIEQQKLKFLVAGNEPKKDAEASSPDKKAAARKVKVEDKSESAQAAATKEVTAESTGEGMNKTSVGESMQQIKIMNSNNISSSSSGSQGVEEPSSPPPAPKPASHKKVPHISCLGYYNNVICL